MKRLLRYAGTALALFAGTVPAAAQPPEGKAAPPTAEQRKLLEERARRLEQAVKELAKQGVSPAVLADIAVYHKAADWVLRHEEFSPPQTAKWALDALDRGLLRAAQAARGETPWLAQRGLAVVRGFVSRIDGSVQPYAVTLPHGYERPREGKVWRLDVVLHGRDNTLTEAKFLARHDGSRDAPKGQDFVLLEVYGRGNNAYRWAGETDVFEAVENFLASEALLGRGGWIDPQRVVLRGFSMGGAGAWHIGLHHPDRWCVVGPGAGFTTTRGYVKSLPEKLPPHQEACLHIYDAVDYAENVFNVPVVAYAGEKDAQLQAARNIERALRGTDLSIKLLVAPGLAHQFPPEWQQKAEEEYAAYAGPGKGRRPFAPRVRFVTYTLRYPGCDWVEILGMGEHYKRALIDAARTEDDGRIEVRTENVTAFRVVMPPETLFPRSITIDGQEVSTEYLSRAFARQGSFQRRGGAWEVMFQQRWVTDRLRKPRKITGLQGPIDDAFTRTFLCVRGLGEGWHPGVSAALEARLERFGKEWDKFLRGRLPVKQDDEVTDADIAGANLVLFGDPASNALIAQVVARLPIRWTKDELVVNGKRYDPATHFPVLIYPNPLNPVRYVVINSGHTFGAEDFRGTNALLYPRLGEYAVLKAAPTGEDPARVEVIDAGLFDEEWQFAGK